MENLQLFAVVGVTSPPVQLKCAEDSKSYTGSVPQPLPPQLLVFSQGEWPARDVGDITLDVFLGAKKIGQITSGARCLSWDTSAYDQPEKVKTLPLEVRVLGLKAVSAAKEKKRASASKATRTPTSKATLEEDQKENMINKNGEKARKKDQQDEVNMPTCSKAKPATTEKKKRLSDKNMDKAQASPSSPTDNKEDSCTDKSKPVAANKKRLSDTSKRPLPATEKKTRQTQLNFFEKKLSPASQAKAVKEEKSKMTLVLDKSRVGESTRSQQQTDVKQMMQARLEDLTPEEMDEQQQKREMQILNETTPQMPDMPSPLPRKPAKSKKRKSDDGDKTPDGITPKKRGTSAAMRALTSETGTPNCARAKVALGDTASKDNIVGPAGDGAENIKSDRKMAHCTDLSGRAPRPSARWGHSMLLAQPRCAVLIGGQGERQQLSRDSVWTLHTETRKWQCQEVQSEGHKPENRMGHTATYDPTLRCIYIYGGSKNLRWFHDVHIYDIAECKWTLAKVNGKAPTRAYHTATLYRHELWIFGGVYPRADPNPDGCSNDVHIFSPMMEIWYTPVVTGEKPLPRSGHSATLMDDQLVMFGGWDAPFCYNDLFILDMTTLDWSKPDVKGMPPKPRSWHASCALSGRRILIHGGYDGDNALGDTFIFDLGSLSWNCLTISNAPCARAGHAAVALPYNRENQEEDEVLIFGGGDNDGTFFQDLLSLSIPFKPLLQSV